MLALGLMFQLAGRVLALLLCSAVLCSVFTLGLGVYACFVNVFGFAFGILFAKSTMLI